MIKMDASNGRDQMALENLDHNKDILEEELKDEDFADFLTLAASFEEILVDTDVLISEEGLYDHKDSSCQCLEKIQEVIPWVVSTEERLQALINLEIATNENDCWLKRMSDKYSLLRLWFVRMRGQ